MSLLLLILWKEFLFSALNDKSLFLMEMWAMETNTQRASRFQAGKLNLLNVIMIISSWFRIKLNQIQPNVEFARKLKKSSLHVHWLDDAWSFEIKQE